MRYKCTVEIEPSFELLEALNVAAADGNRTEVHHSLCGASDYPGNPFRDQLEPCSCGMPGLLRQLRDLLPVPAWDMIWLRVNIAVTMVVPIPKSAMVRSERSKMRRLARRRPVMT